MAGDRRDARARGRRVAPRRVPVDDAGAVTGLSKQLDPTELSRILSASLPPLDATVIGSLAEGFERLDRHRAEREEYSTTLAGVRSFLDVYRQYASSFVKARAVELTLTADEIARLS